MYRSTSIIALALGVCAAAGPLWAGPPKDVQSTPLIPRDVLFGNPDKSSPQISPDGTQLAYLAEVDGVINVWVGPIDQPDAAKPITQDKKRGVRAYFWAFTNRHILYVQDKDGDENWHVYAVDLKNNNPRDLTPLPGIQARVQGVNHKFPTEVLIGINDRTKELHDLYRVNIETGERKLLKQNEGFAGFVTDNDYRVRMATKTTPDGGKEIVQIDEKGEGWKPFLKVSPEDVLGTGVAGFDKTGKVLYLTSSIGRDTAALLTHDLASGKEQVIASDPKSDLGGIMAHPTEKSIQAVTFNYTRQNIRVLDDSIKGDIDYLRTVADGDLNVGSRTLDDKHWIVVYVMDNGPVRYYFYDRAAKKATFLFTNRKALEGLPLTRMHPVVIKSRDGFDLVSYLSLPIWTDPDGDGRPSAPVPMVLNVHGGPWARDAWGYSADDQWLTNRGYAVLSVNFRASTGFGKKFTNAGDKEWGRKAHDDLLDAVDWAIKEKIADPAKVAIMGGSYGGYATLVGLTMTPDKFACGVDIVGPSSLVTLLESVPPYWKPMLDIFTTRIGDHRTEEGKKMLLERSPITLVEKIKKPLLIGQGANDPRVKQAESDRIVKAMEEKKIPVAYVLFPDEGHGFARPENNKAFNAVTEAFLSQHLGGRFEPVGEDFAGSSITVLKGQDQVPGLKDALPKEGDA